MHDAIPMGEAERLATVRTLEKAPDPFLNGLASCAADATGASTAAVNLVEASTVRPHAIVGPLAHAFPLVIPIRRGDALRRGSFCPQVVARAQMLCVRDTLVDHAYAAHPLVEDYPHLRRYIGAPILVDGYAVGSMCAFDDAPAPFRPEAAEQMMRLAGMASRRYADRRDTETRRNLVDCIPDGWGTVDRDLRVRDVNAHLCRLLGRGRHEIVGRPALEFVAAEEREDWRAAMGDLSPEFGQGPAIRTVLVGASEERLPVRIWLKAWNSGDEKMIGGVIRPAGDRSVAMLVSTRQRECLRWAGAGKTDGEIAQLMGIAQSTVHNHIEAAKRKLGVSTRIQAILASHGVNQPDLIRSFSRNANRRDNHKINGG